MEASNDNMHQSAQYKGNDKLLSGIILGVLAFWLFAQTILNIREAAFFALLFNLFMVRVAIIAIMKTIPKSEDKNVSVQSK